MALGKRIRKIRKEQKMTLVDLAGDEITKGMLSLIENEKSRPSMETLEYIANRLNVSIGYLTRDGDEEWTREMVENEVFYDTYKFPEEFVEKNILPKMEKISSSKIGMDLYHIVRVYYRYTGQHGLADQITEKIGKFYEQTGLKNLALKDQLNDVLSMLYSRDYKEGYEKLLSVEDDIRQFKEYDSGLELDYLHWRSVFAIEFDEDDFIEYGNALIDMSFKRENFKYYFQQIQLFGLYYGTAGNMDKYEKYNDDMRSYLNFNPHSIDSFEYFTDEGPIQLWYILVEDQDTHVNDLKNLKEKFISYEEQNPFYQKNYANILKMMNLEIDYHAGNFETVLKNYDSTLYDRPVAQFPLDRILIATRAAIYPMALFRAGRTAEARTEFERLESSIPDLKNSIFTKEFFNIKDIIFNEDK